VTVGTLSGSVTLPSRARRLLVIGAIAFVTSGAAAAHALAAGPGVQLQPVAWNLTQPLFVTSAPGGGRLFIVEQGGVIKLLEPGASAPTVFLDISANVFVDLHQGLVGLAFHPQYATNGRFFIDYNRKSDAATVIAEYRASPDNSAVAAPSETALLTIGQPLPNLTGGTLAFGPDGYLYIGVGQAGVDDDPGNTAQDLGQLLGKILRIDVDRASGPTPYASPADNPFVGPTQARYEIWAYGLRNPWRFSFDRLTGDLLAGDVGNHQREEIDRIVRGGNYGWRVREGAICSGYVPAACDAPGFIPPLVDYGHDNGRCAVVGGYVYRGTRGTLPAGSYVFGDFCSGEIFLLEGGAMRVLLTTPFVISSFGEDRDGELYVVDWLGTVYRIAPAGPPAGGLLASVLPGSRSVEAGAVASAFATMIWTGAEPATDCGIALLTPRPIAQFVYQTTDPSTNALVGTPNTPVRIDPGGRQTFLVAVTPAAPTDATDLLFGFACAGVPPPPVIPGLNTLLLSAGSGPVPDILAMAATLTHDGVVTIRRGAGGAFTVAIVNAGAAAAVTASAAAGDLPVTASICASDPGTGACVAAPAPSVTRDVGAGATSTFTVFLATSSPVAFDPAGHRVTVRFNGPDGVTRGLTSVAVRTIESILLPKMPH